MKRGCQQVDLKEIIEDTTCHGKCAKLEMDGVGEYGPCRKACCNACKRMGYTDEKVKKCEKRKKCLSKIWW